MTLLQQIYRGHDARATARARVGGCGRHRASRSGEGGTRRAPAVWPCACPGDCCAGSAPLRRRFPHFAPHASGERLCGAGPRSSWPRRGYRGCRGLLWQRRVTACGPARGCQAWSARSTRRPQPCCKSDPERSRLGAILCHTAVGRRPTPSACPLPAGGCAQSAALTPLLVARPRQAMMAPKACSSAGRAMLSWTRRQRASVAALMTTLCGRGCAAFVPAPTAWDFRTGLAMPVCRAPSRVRARFS